MGYLLTTTEGEIDVDQLAKTVGFESRPELHVIWIEWRREGRLVRRDTFGNPKTGLGVTVIYTTKGELPVDQLVKIEIFEERTLAYLVRTEWRLGDEAGELVREDRWCCVKDAGVVAVGSVGALNG